MSYSFASKEQIKLARVISSVRLAGPPMSDELMRLVCHLFTPEEADVARKLPFFNPRPLSVIARRTRKPAQSIEPLLATMAEKRVIYRSRKGYALFPLVPGMFEYMLINGVDSPWHRRFAELFHDLFATGYIGHYTGTPVPATRTIPLQAPVDHQSRVVNKGFMAEMIDCHDRFAVANVCQCRQVQRFRGEACKRADHTDGCLVFGSFADGLIKAKSGRYVEKAEMREIVAERWEKGLVFFTANVSAKSPNAICTCCDCCCHFLETVNHYQGKNLVAPPEVIAVVDEVKCNHCGRCIKACNTHAHRISNKTHFYDAEKCIGCGLCVSACPENAITMQENPGYKSPAGNFGVLGAKLMPAVTTTALKVKIKRR
ncbi:MAG: 4Fe-4S binding protein [Thermodesulfobacteriota bacterium]|nr:4Fe-4S binding protein [Thermodesulfobacteriota bacterium]